MANSLQNREGNIESYTRSIWNVTLVYTKDPKKSVTLFSFFSSPWKFMTTPLFKNLRKRQSYNFLSLNWAKNGVVELLYSST